MRIVLTYGTYDLLHIGHINLLRRAKELGDYLIVGLSTDEFNKIKGKKAYHNFDERKKLLEAIKYVDLIIEENSWEDKRKHIKEFNVDALVMGSDWEGKFDDLSDLCEITYLPRTEGISTTKIKRDLKYS
ncbi:MAG: glycerol-3-phosphate cytidylyltransferase [Clostridiales bacterium]|nr:glycerol-3-phosphate cytidylyltransferase [Clostridiales bacterium]